jgi:hypothetical protein
VLAGLLVIVLILLLLFSSRETQEAGSLLLITLLGFPLAVLAHEAGHVVAGRVLGFRLLAVAIGPFTWRREEVEGGRGRLRFGLEFTWRNVIGYAQHSFPALGELRDYLLVYIAWGLLASAGFVIFAAIETALFLNAILGGVRQFMPVWWLTAILVAAGWLSILVLALNLYPSRWIATDGHKLLALLRSRVHARRYVALVRVMQANQGGQRPRDWEAALVDDLTVLNDRSAQSVQAHHLAYRWALDRGDLASAEKFLARAVESRHLASPPQRATLMIEAAFIEMRYRANRAHAQAWLRKLRGEMGLAEQLPKWRMLCATEIVLGQTSVARAVARRALQAVDDAPHRREGVAAAERDLFQEMLHETLDSPASVPVLSAEGPPP